jgi:3-phosphoshikimate 1-carboxyvinyltransferase
MPSTLKVKAGQPLKGITTVSGDKSISHRAVMFGGLLARGKTHIRGWLRAGDTLSTLRAVRGLGIHVEEISDQELIVHGAEPRPPQEPLNLGHAGTGIRLIAGILAGQPFPTTADGSEQLRRRPMKRIIEPLSLMGAEITSNENRAPLNITPAPLKAIRYQLPVASAQVKSAIILAGLFADGTTTIIEAGPSRDHTEVMLKSMGANINYDGKTVEVNPLTAPLNPIDITIPGDFSSAAFLLVAGSIIPGSDITLTHINLNPTRTGLLDALLAMGADITVTPTGDEAGEPVGDLRIRYAPLKGVEISGDLVVRMIDEFPALMIASLCAEGQTLVREAEELRVKETDRITVMASELRKLGAELTETPDGFIIEGGQKLTGAIVQSHDDHRIAMSMAIAGLIADGVTTIEEANCTADSFPNFEGVLTHLGASLE